MTDPQDHHDIVRCDVLVIGSGAGGLSAAATAACLGLKVIVLEKESQFGGTTAWSGGWMWIPRNPLAVDAGIVEPIDAALTYLQHELGDQFGSPTTDDPAPAVSKQAALPGPDHRQAKLRAFLEHGPQMVRFYREHTAVQFIDGNLIPDFHGDSPGAIEGGRSVCAAPFDAHELGPKINLLRPPLDLTSLWGMGIASGADLRHFLNATRSWPSFVHAAKRVSRHVLDKLLYGRGMHLVAGNALAARLAKTLFDHGGELRVSTRVTELLTQDGTPPGQSQRVIGARATGPYSVPVEFRASKGVVLACGGFAHDTRRKRQMFAHAPTGKEHWSAAPPSNTGDGLRMAEKIGARVRKDLPHPGAWAPVSLVPRRDGTVGAFPHLIERGKPGLIAVTRQGKRFVNEAGSYHDFMSALFVAHGLSDPLHADTGKQALEQIQHSLKPPIEAWLICDHPFLRRWGLGHVKPSPLPIGPALQSGYLKRGATLAELAQACGIDADGLQATIDAYNPAASRGKDPAFGRGSTRYNRVQGDPEHGPNPCVAPIVQPPFYAVRVVPGSLGTFAGLDTDPHARVLDDAGQTIAGLYAAGNDMSSIMGGRYPSGGITLGPAMTFGFIAAHDLAGRNLPTASHASAAIHPPPTSPSTQPDA